jgi:hypothetical protein
MSGPFCFVYLCILQTLNHTVILQTLNHISQFVMQYS